MLRVHSSRASTCQAAILLNCWSIGPPFVSRDYDTPWYWVKSFFSSSTTRLLRNSSSSIEGELSQSNRKVHSPPICLATSLFNCLKMLSASGPTFSPTLPQRPSSAASLAITVRSGLTGCLRHTRLRTSPSALGLVGLRVSALFNFACGNSSDVNGATYHVGWAFLPLRPLGHIRGAPLWH